MEVIIVIQMGWMRPSTRAMVLSFGQAQTLEFEIDVGGNEGVADFFDHAIEGFLVEGLGAREVCDGGVDAPAEVL